MDKIGKKKNMPETRVFYYETEKSSGRFKGGFSDESAVRSFLFTAKNNQDKPLVLYTEMDGGDFKILWDHTNE